MGRLRAYSTTGTSAKLSASRATGTSCRQSYAAVGALHAGFELYRAFPEDERRFAEFERTKLPMPVLALAGDKSNGMVELTMAQGLATDVRGGIAPDAGHWLPDENPDFLSEKLIAFLRERAH